MKAVNSVLYSTAGNYEQDAALQKPVLPGLSCLTDLQGMEPGSSDHHFLQTYLVRERNRVADSLQRAAQLLEDTTVIVAR